MESVDQDVQILVLAYLQIKHVPIFMGSEFLTQCILEQSGLSKHLDLLRMLDAAYHERKATEQESDDMVKLAKSRSRGAINGRY